MNLTEARKILGLEPEEDPCPHIPGFESAREHIAAMVRSAPNETLAERYRKGLVEFDEALAAVRTYLESKGETIPPLLQNLSVPGTAAPASGLKTIAQSSSQNEVTGPTPAPEPITASEAPEVKHEAPVIAPAAPLKTIAESLTSQEDTPSADSPAKELPTQKTSESPDLQVAKIPENSEPGSMPAPESKLPVQEEKEAASPIPPATPAPAKVVAEELPPARTMAPTVVLKDIPAPRSPVAAATPGVVATPEEEPSASPDDEPVKGNRTVSYFAWFLVLLTLGMGGGWFYLEYQQSLEDKRNLEISNLERQGATMLENRRWQEAEAAFNRIEQLSPGSEIAKRGLRGLEVGKGEEQQQNVGYLIGQANAELEAGRVDEAEKAARELIARYPQEKEGPALLDKINAAKITHARMAILTKAREAVENARWDEAIAHVRPLLDTPEKDAEANAIIAEASAGKQKQAADLARASELLAMAVARDNGQFDKEALEWLREAASLAPENEEIKSRLEKLSSYTRTLRVPGDYETPAEALQEARDRDRVVLGAGVWKGPLVINAAIELQGAGHADTRVECSPEQGSPITIGPDAKGARISGISFRHEVFATGSERYSAALVRGGGVTFTDCRFTEASGHGLAVIEGGQASASRCRFADNGWDGVAAMGNGSRLELRDCEALNNYEHGIESWDGAAVILVNNRASGNSRNGIHVDNGLASASIEGNQLLSNREFGLVVGSAAGGKISGNSARSNLLGGIVIRAAAGNLPATGNQATQNKGPGIVIERGLSATAYANNTASKNEGRQIITDTDLSVTEELPVETPEETDQPSTDGSSPTTGIGSNDGVPLPVPPAIDPTAADPDATPPPRAIIVIEGDVAEPNREEP